jgi:hypothetical protein
VPEPVPIDVGGHDVSVAIGKMDADRAQDGQRQLAPADAHAREVAPAATGADADEQTSSLLRQLSKDDVTEMRRLPASLASRSIADAIRSACVQPPTGAKNEIDAS